jgi:hypothetical protein
MSIGTRQPGARGLAAVIVLLSLACGGVFAATSGAATGPANTALPALAGSTVEGQILTTSTGTWTGAAPITYAYRWQRCNPDGSACADIAGAIANAYTLGSADVGNTVRSVVTATDSTGSSDVQSAISPSITALVAAAPAAAGPPAITGTPTAGQTLTANEGAYTGTQPISFTYSWERCDVNGATCAAIPAATQRIYVLSSLDIGKTIRVRLTATNASGSSSLTSVPTAVIAVGVPASATKLSDGSLSIEAADVGGAQRLVLDQFKVDVSQPIHTREAFKITFHVSDTRGYSVRNALVYLIGLPYNRIARVPEQKTSNDGTATFTIAPTKLQPLKVGARIVIFARARVESDKLLAGASTRRLIEVVFGAPKQ